MSSIPQKRNKGPSQALEGQVQRLAAQYEQRLGHLPIWLHDLDSERIGPLLACCIRLGMPLPMCDLLETDDAERREQEGRSIRRPKPP